MSTNLCWYFDKELLGQTPSFFDGVDSALEARYRQIGARFILLLGGELGLRHEACATAVVYFHRFYMFHSFKDLPIFVTAACCLLLAGKVNETPKKCRDIVNVAQKMLGKEQFKQFQSDPREEVMNLERVLLKTIRFDLQVEHPYKYLLQFAKRLRHEQLNIIVQMSWTFINDSLCTSLCLMYEPEIIACAVLYLACKIKQIEIKDWQGRVSHQRWWECFIDGLSVEILDEICHQILDFYNEGNNGDKELFAKAPSCARNDGSGANWRGNAERMRAKDPELIKNHNYLLFGPKPAATSATQNNKPENTVSVGHYASTAPMNQHKSGQSLAVKMEAMSSSRPFASQPNASTTFNHLAVAGYPVTAAVLQNTSWFPTDIPVPPNGPEKVSNHLEQANTVVYSGNHHYAPSIDNAQATFLSSRSRSKD